MKKLLFIITLCVLFSCGKQNNTTADQNTLAELKAFEAKNSEEKNTKQFVENYIDAVNAEDWKAKLPKYLPPNPEKFLEEHTAFRKSFPNYKSTIKHLVVNGNKVILWLNIKANYAATYTFENSAYKDDILKGLEAKNQTLSWNETWYFDVVDGRFGNEWDFLKDNHAILEGLDTDKLP